MAFDDLYQEIILDHYKNPRNSGEIHPNSETVEHENPLCGDRIKLTVCLDKHSVIQDLKFAGHGCAISMASASMMTDLVKGKKTNEVKRIINDFISVMNKKKQVNILENYGDLMALKGVIKFPVRIKCATLAWHALKEALTV
jgi:nitrogen fixation NifU-like protein